MFIVQDTAGETKLNPLREGSAVKGNMNNDTGLCTLSLSDIHMPPYRWWTWATFTRSRREVVEWFTDTNTVQLCSPYCSAIFQHQLSSLFHHLLFVLGAGRMYSIYLEVYRVTRTLYFGYMYKVSLYMYIEISKCFYRQVNVLKLYIVHMEIKPNNNKVHTFEFKLFYYCIIIKLKSGSFISDFSTFERK